MNELPDSADGLFSWNGTFKFSDKGITGLSQSLMSMSVSSGSDSRQISDYDPTFFGSSQTADKCSATLPANASAKEGSKSNDSRPSSPRLAN